MDDEQLAAIQAAVTQFFADVKNRSELRDRVAALQSPQFRATLERALAAHTDAAELTAFRRSEDKFARKVQREWRPALQASDTMYLHVYDEIETYIGQVNALPAATRDAKTARYQALLNITARSLQIFMEVTTLLANGFADAAFGRWRSLYELGILAAFISHEDEPVAAAFINAKDTSERYDWAKKSPALKAVKRHLRFADLQDASGLDTTPWHDDYMLANQVLHPSAQGTFQRIGDIGDADNITVGRTNFGLEAAGEHAAVSLREVCEQFFGLYPEAAPADWDETLAQDVRTIRQAYYQAHDRLFPDTPALWHD